MSKHTFRPQDHGLSLPTGPQGPVVQAIGVLNPGVAVALEAGEWSGSSRSSTVFSGQAPPPVVSAGLRQRSTKTQDGAVGVDCRSMAHDETREPINSAAIIKAADVLMPLSPSRPCLWLLPQPPQLEKAIALHLALGIEAGHYPRGVPQLLCLNHIPQGGQLSAERGQEEALNPEIPQSSRWL
jgi:hypothetical protein